MEVTSVAAEVKFSALNIVFLLVRKFESLGTMPGYSHKIDFRKLRTRWNPNAEIHISRPTAKDDPNI
jgi:hypothetical protein